MKMEQKLSVSKLRINLFSYLCLFILAVSVILPIWLLFLNSVKSDAEVRTNILGWPKKFRFENFIEAWETANYSSTFKNSLIVTVSTIIIVCVIASLGAYALSRLQLPGTDIIVMYFLSVMSIPSFLYIIPLFSLWRSLKMVDTLFGIILIYSALYLPFSIFLLRSFMLSLPVELEDAARIDGCSTLGVFTKIVLPLSRPALLAVVVIVGMWSWNEFLFATTFLSSPSLKTAPVGFYSFMGRFHRQVPLINAAAMILILPVMITYVFLQKQFIEGMTSGAFKG